MSAKSTTPAAATNRMRTRLSIPVWVVCAEISAPARENMTKAMVHLIEGNVAALVDDAVDLDFLPDGHRQGRAGAHPLGRVFDGARLAAKSMDGVPVQKRRKEFAAVSADLNNIFFEQPFRVPDYRLVTRALIVLEGIALSGDPSFDIFKAAYPHGLRRARAVRRRGAGADRRGGRPRACSGARRTTRRPTPIARRLTTCARVCMRLLLQGCLVIVVISVDGATGAEVRGKRAQGHVVAPIIPGIPPSRCHQIAPAGRLVA